MKFLSSRLSFVLTALFIVLFLATGLVRPAQASAQGASSLTIDSFRVDILPEYDQPASVLVIYNIKLSTQTTLPVQMTVRIPAAAGKPNAVAWMMNDQGPYDLAYETSTAGDWTEVKFNALSPDIRIEYYDPSLNKTDDQRKFTFRWPADYLVNNFSMQIQQPINASGMTLSPAAGSGQKGSDGLTYFSVVAGKIAAGTIIEQSMTYTKPDDVLTNTNQFQNAKPNQPVNSGTAGRVNSEQILPWIIGGLAVLMIAAGVLWYWRAGLAGRTAESAARPRHSPRRAATPIPAAPVEEGAFCHHCGKRAAAGDVFCRACGTKLK